MSPIVDPLAHHFAVPTTKVRQTDELSCGPAVAQSIMADLGLYMPQPSVALHLGTNGLGTNLGQMIGGLRQMGLNAQNRRAGSTMETLAAELSPIRRVAVSLWAYGTSHWVSLVGWTRRYWYFMDPAGDTLMGYVSRKDMAARWANNDEAVIVWRQRRVKPVSPVPEILQEIPR